MASNRIEQRRRIAEALRANPQASNRQIAHDTRAEHKTVATVRRALVETGDLPAMDRTVGRDGKSRPATREPGIVSRAIGGLVEGVRKLIGASSEGPTIPHYRDPYEDKIKIVGPIPPGSAAGVTWADEDKTYNRPPICPKCACHDMRMDCIRCNLGKEVHIRKCRNCGRRASYIVVKK